VDGFCLCRIGISQQELESFSAPYVAERLVLEDEAREKGFSTNQIAEQRQKAAEVIAAAS